MHIRIARPEDAGACLEIYGPLVMSSAVSFETSPPDDTEMRDRISGVLSYAPWLIGEQGGSVVGYATACRFRDRPAYCWTVETSVYVVDAGRGLGYGKALYGALLSGVAWQGYRQAIGVIALPNPASESLHRRCGFDGVGVLRRVGFKLGGWHDVSLWQKALVGGVCGVVDGGCDSPGAGDAPRRIRSVSDVVSVFSW